jgi:putative FmdB family regulatory protein
VPVYEYRCAGCQHGFQRFFKSIAAAGDVSCPNCGRAGAERAISSFAYHQSLQMQIESLDPKYEQELDWADRHHQATDPMNRLNLDFSGPSRDD